MQNKISNSWLKALSALATNLSAGWFGAVLIVPNFAEFELSKGLLILITDIIFGMVCLLIAVDLERRMI